VESRLIKALSRPQAGVESRPSPARYCTAGRRFIGWLLLAARSFLLSNNALLSKFLGAFCTPRGGFHISYFIVRRVAFIRCFPPVAQRPACSSGRWA
jgi:hypothetical protein